MQCNRKKSLVLARLSVAALLLAGASSVGATYLFIKDGARMCDALKAAECSEKTTPNVEKGTVLGHPYTIRSDSSGAVAVDRETQNPESAHLFQVWRITCKKDAISGAPSCVGLHRDLGIIVERGKKPLVALGYDHFPGKPMSIRVGSVVFTKKAGGDFGQSDSAKIIKAMTEDGVEVATRFYMWPSDSPREQVFPAGGAQAAIEMMRWLVSN